MDLEDYKTLYNVIYKNKQGCAHWEANLRKYAHKAAPLFDVFTSVESLRFVLFSAMIDLPDCTELHLMSKVHKSDNGIAFLTHNESFAKVCEEGYLDIARALLQRTKVDLEAKNTTGWTPLHMTAGRGHISLVQHLCQQGADKAALDRYDSTPLLWAAEEGHLPVVQYLCEQGTDKEVRDEDGRTPLDIAARKGHALILEFLRNGL